MDNDQGIPNLTDYDESCDIHDTICQHVRYSW